MKTLIFSTLILLFVGCSVTRKYDISGFTTEGNTVYYNSQPMAKLKGVEFALDNNKMVRELSFELLNGDNNDKIHNLISYLHSRYNEYEIEVEIPSEEFNPMKE